MFCHASENRSGFDKNKARGTDIEIKDYLLDRTSEVE